MYLEDLGIKTTGTGVIIHYYKSLLEAIAYEEDTNGIEADNAYDALWNTFPALRDAVLAPKCLLLWSDEQSAVVHILNNEEQVAEHRQNAARLFVEYPITASNDPQYDEFLRKCRFTAEITLDQLKQLAVDELDNPYNFSIDELGLTFNIEDYAHIVEAHERGEI